MSGMEAFSAEVGSTGPVCVRGGGTRWRIGGDVGAEVRAVHAPAGIDSHDPAEMTVAVWAGTTLATLAETLAERRQEVALDGPPGSTVGGSLAVGWNGIRFRRTGSVRDALLQAECVGADGQVFKAGGPTVKNVSGYELCRLLVGSLGTLALTGRVILRTRPIPERSLWLRGAIAPSEVERSCYRPSSILWDGHHTYACLEGYGVDVDQEASDLAECGMVEVEGPPDLPPDRQRWAGELPSGAVLDVPIGVVHCHGGGSVPAVDPAVKAIADRLKANFDPQGRLNPGRDPYMVPE